LVVDVMAKKVVTVSTPPPRVMVTAPIVRPSKKGTGST
jgi:hypothetical protein